MARFFTNIRTVATWPEWFKPILAISSLLVMLLTVGSLVGQTRKLTFKVEKEVNGVLTQVDTTVIVRPETDVDALMRSLGIKPHADFNGLTRPVMVGDSMRTLQVDVNRQREKNKAAAFIQVFLGGDTIRLREEEGFWVGGENIRIPVETGGVLTVGGESIQLAGRGGAAARTPTVSMTSPLRLSIWPLSKPEQNLLLTRTAVGVSGLNKAALKSVWQPTHFQIRPDASTGTYTLGFDIDAAADSLFIQVFPEQPKTLESQFKLTQPRFSGSFETVWNAADWPAGTYWLWIRHGANDLWRKIKLDE